MQVKFKSSSRTHKQREQMGLLAMGICDAAHGRLRNSVLDTYRTTVSAA